jgi:hypothetical protein
MMFWKKKKTQIHGFVDNIRFKDIDRVKYTSGIWSEFAIPYSITIKDTEDGKKHIKICTGYYDDYFATQVVTEPDDAEYLSVMLLRGQLSSFIHPIE